MITVATLKQCTLWFKSFKNQTAPSKKSYYNVKLSSLKLLVK